MTSVFTRILAGAPILIVFLAQETWSAATLRVFKYGKDGTPSIVDPSGPTDRRVYQANEKSTMYNVELTGNSFNGSVNNELILIDKLVAGEGGSDEESTTTERLLEDYSYNDHVSNYGKDPSIVDPPGPTDRRVYQANEKSKMYNVELTGNSFNGSVNNELILIDKLVAGEGGSDEKPPATLRVFGGCSYQDREYGNNPSETDDNAQEKLKIFCSYGSGGNNSSDSDYYDWW